MADTLRDAGTDPGAAEATGAKVSLLRVRMANEGLIKAEVVDRAPATEMVFDLVGREHDALLNWPPRAAPSALFAPRHVSEEMSQR